MIPAPARVAVPVLLGLDETDEHCPWCWQPLVRACYVLGDPYGRPSVPSHLHTVVYCLTCEGP